MDKTALRVVATEEESKLKAGFKALVDRVAEAFKSGATEIDLTFQGIDKTDAMYYAAGWMTVREFDFGQAGKRNIAPIMVLTECFKGVVGYPIGFSYGTGIPGDVIRLRRV